MPAEMKRKDFEALIFTGVIDDTFDFYGQKVHMGLLQEKESIEVRRIAGMEPLFNQEARLRIETLARAIFEINGQSFPGDNQVAKANFLKEYLLGELQTPVINRLWEKYLILRSVQEAELATKEKDLKNSLGSPTTPEPTGL